LLFAGVIAKCETQLRQISKPNPNDPVYPVKQIFLRLESIPPGFMSLHLRKMYPSPTVQHGYNCLQGKFCERLKIRWMGTPKPVYRKIKAVFASAPRLF
jgi:hypothetical protein